jgi:NADPH2:quinone reductase
MNCVEVSKPGGPEVLVPARRPLPAPKPGEVIVEVHAAGVNRPDILQREAGYPAPPGASELPGLEVAGRVVQDLGDGSWPTVGTQVCALTAGGGYADHVAVDARHCLPIPDGLTMIEAAALPETFFTVWHNVFERGRLTAGESFLVHGGAGGIGTTALQLAKAFGARVYTTASAPKLDRCRALGADVAIDYAAENFADVIKDDTKGRGVDVILDMVGGDYIARNIKSLAPDGRLVSIAFQKGSVAEVNFMSVMLKRLTITGSTLRPQSADAKARMAQGLKTQVWPLLSAAGIKPVIHAAFPLAQAADAHRMIESGTHIGKIVLTV